MESVINNVWGCVRRRRGGAKILTLTIDYQLTRQLITYRLLKNSRGLTAARSPKEFCIVLLTVKTNLDKVNEDRDAPGLSLQIKHKITLVRHGITDWNKKFRYQGVTDVPLSTEGEEQAKKAALRLSCESVGRIISSPLKRSLKTAEIIAESIGLSAVDTWDELTEVDFGAWEGLTVPQIKEKFGEETFAKWKASQVDVTATNGEDTDRIYKRSEACAARILSLTDEHVLVVGHGALFRTMLLPLIGIPRGNVFWKMKMDNCSLSGIGIDKKNRAFIVFFNDTIHLKTKMNCIKDIPLPW